MTESWRVQKTRARAALRSLYNDDANRDRLRRKKLGSMAVTKLFGLCPHCMLDRGIREDLDECKPCSAFESEFWMDCDHCWKTEWEVDCVGRVLFQTDVLVTEVVKQCNCCWNSCDSVQDWKTLKLD
jgi:hypothetical protein